MAIFEPMLMKPKCACQQEMYLSYLLFLHIFQLFAQNTLYHLTFIKRILASFLDFFYRGQWLYYYKSKRSAATDKKLYVPSSESEQYAFVFSGNLQRTCIFRSRALAYFFLVQSHYLIISNLVVLNQLHMESKKQIPSSIICFKEMKATLWSSDDGQLHTTS